MILITFHYRTMKNSQSALLGLFRFLPSQLRYDPLLQITDLFRLCPPSLVGAYYLRPPDARAIFLHNDLPCNDTCSVTGGSITYWGGGGGGTNGKDPRLRTISYYKKCGTFVLGGTNNMHPLSWGRGHKRKWSEMGLRTKHWGPKQKRSKHLTIIAKFPFFGYPSSA